MSSERLRESARIWSRFPQAFPRAAAALGGLALAVSVFLPWDAGVRDLAGQDVFPDRAAGAFAGVYFPQDPATALELLLPFGVALVLVAGLAFGSSARGVAGPAPRLAVGIAAAATLSLLVRQLGDAADGVPIGGVVGNAGAVGALAAVLGLPLPRTAQRSAWPAVALAAASGALLTALVHDGYAAIDTDVFFSVGAGPQLSWPERWLVESHGVRTVVDAGLIAVATLGLLAASLALTRGLPRAAAIALAALAGLDLAALLVVAVGPNPGVAGIDRFPAAALAALALVVIAFAGLRSSRSPPAAA